MKPRSANHSDRPIQQAVRATCRNFLRRFVILGAGLLLASAPGLAFAQEVEDDDPFDRPGWYLGVGGSYQYNVFEDEIEDELNDELGTNGNLDIEDSGGLNATVGYRAFSFLALELEYEWVSEYDFDASIAGFSGTLYTIEGHTLTANTKWIIPFWRIQPYLLLGGGLAVSDVDIDSSVQAALKAGGVDIDDGRTTKAAGRGGVGLDLYITENILLNAEAGIVVTTLKEPDVDDIEDLNYLSFQGGLQYRF